MHLPNFVQPMDEFATFSADGANKDAKFGEGLGTNQHAGGRRISCSFDQEAKRKTHGSKVTKNLPP